MLAIESFHCVCFRKSSVATLCAGQLCGNCIAAESRSTVLHGLQISSSERERGRPKCKHEKPCRATDTVGVSPLTVARKTCGSDAPRTDEGDETQVRCSSLAGRGAAEQGGVLLDSLRSSNPCLCCTEGMQQRRALAHGANPSAFRRQGGRCVGCGVNVFHKY